MKAAISFPDRNRETDSLTRAVVAHIVAAVDGRQNPAATCHELYPSDNRAIKIATRAAVGIGSTTGWGSPVVSNVVASFIATLAPASAIARLIPMGITIPLEGHSVANVPIRSTNPIVAAGVGEGQPIQVRANSFSQVAMVPGKASVITVITKELAKRAGGQSAIETILREDAGATLDAAYLSTAPAGDLPAGLLNGVTPIVSDQAVNPADAKYFLGKLVASAAVNGSGDVVLIMSPSRAAKLKVFLPEMQIPVLASIAVPQNRIIAVDPTALVHGFGGVPEIDVSESSTLHMDSEPLPLVQGAVPAVPIRSMFQTASVSLRMILDIAFAKRSATSVAYIDDATGW